MQCLLLHKRNSLVALLQDRKKMVSKIVQKTRPKNTDVITIGICSKNKTKIEGRTLPLQTNILGGWVVWKIWVVMRGSFVASASPIRTQDNKSGILSSYWATRMLSACANSGIVRRSHGYVMSWTSRVMCVSHVAHVCGSCHMYEWPMLYTWMNHVAHVCESCHLYGWVTSHMCVSRVLYATTWRSYARETSRDVLRKGARDTWEVMRCLLSWTLSLRDHYD